MRAGPLNERIRLERPVRTITPDRTFETQWELVAEVWASVREARARERWAAPKPLAEGSASIWIRYREVDMSWRVVWRRQAFHVVGIAEIGRREGIELTVERSEA